MKRWIIALSVLVLLQTTIIVKQAQTISRADAQISKMKKASEQVWVCPGDSAPIPVGVRMEVKP